MTTRLLRFWLAALAVIALGGDEASAQWVRGWRGGGVVVRAPYVGAIRVGVGPLVPRVVPRVVGVAPILPRRRIVAAPPIVVPPVGVVPRYAGGASVAPRYQPGAVVAPQYQPDVVQTDARPFLSPTELANLDNTALLNATLDALNRLDADVARFDTGDTWVAYFRIPQEAFPPPTADNRVELGLAAIRGLLARFDAIAADPAYPMISGLPSFRAARAALTEVVVRFARAAGDAAAAQPAGEELPVPAAELAPAESAASGERSILSR